MPKCLGKPKSRLDTPHPFALRKKRTHKGWRGVYVEGQTPQRRGDKREGEKNSAPVELRGERDHAQDPLKDVMKTQ